MSDGRVRVRPRTDADADALLAALRPVHEHDGYPLRAEHLTTGWLYDGIDHAWVAERDGRLLGHAAVLPSDQRVALTRFFVARDARGCGAGSALLDVVEAWADERTAELVLDVVEHNTDAMAMYERRGWSRTGEVEARWVGGEAPWPTAFVYTRRPSTR